jgi:calcineurin-like phosphoesterase family protein
MTWALIRAGASMALLSTVVACSPQRPPDNVPDAPNPQLEPFRAAIARYVESTNADRAKAAQISEQVPGQNAPRPSAENAVRTRANTLATALRETVRPQAKQGDLFGAAADIIREDIREKFDGPERDLLMDALAEQNDTGKASSPAPPIAINQRIDAPRVPPLLVETLPPLPRQLEYDFVGRTLILRDVDAEVVADFLPQALPEPPPRGDGAPAQHSAPAQGAPPLPLPGNRGSTVFAAIGDSGSGDAAQDSIARAMLTYFTSGRRFRFVLLLGDNLYHDDYTGEFLTPYKALLDRGVKFHAALGNHDRDLQIHFKPFNMNDREFYSFDDGNARFVALNSNRPSDPAQAKWFETVFADAAAKWRICFFHHPLYSSGQHAEESAQVIRPALEDALVQAQVNIVFSGHEHLYERIAPQQSVRYFVSGGGGRNLYQVRPSEFDEVAVSEHHFMALEIDGNRLFYEAVTATQDLLDCGLLFRTADEAAKPADKNTQAWLDSCSTLRAKNKTRTEAGPDDRPR